MNNKIIDPVDLAGKLIRCPSVTPVDAGALGVLQDALEGMGFSCRRYPFGAAEQRVDNLYARLGTSAPNFCYAGHVDVVPAGGGDGDSAQWRHNPFGGEIADGKIWGRGAADMKGGIATFVAAVSEFLAGGNAFDGSISFLITGDEEGPALNGTRKVLKAITEAGEIIDHCLVGEPTNPNRLGEMIKIGRRGSLNGVLTVIGTQGHVAYPDLAGNPVPILLKLLTALASKKLDDGNDSFQPSNLEITSIDVDNPTHNIIAGAAKAKFNIRFNTEHTGDDLLDWINAEIEKAGRGFEGRIEADLSVPGHPFLTRPCAFTEKLSAAIEDVTGQKPVLSTSGGTSDSRFITHYAPVVEFGLIGKTIHKVNEYAEIADIKNLKQIYKAFLVRYFAV